MNPQDVQIVVTDPVGLVIAVAFFVFVGYLLAHVTEQRIEPHPSSALPARIVDTHATDWPLCDICEQCRPADAFMTIEGMRICRRGCEEPAPIARERVAC